MVHVNIETRVLFAMTVMMGGADRVYEERFNAPLGAASGQACNARKSKPWDPELCK